MTSPFVVKQTRSPANGEPSMSTAVALQMIAVPASGGVRPAFGAQ